MSSGYLPLGRVLEPDRVADLGRRADALALGEAANPNVQVQRDTGGGYDELAPARPASDDRVDRYRKVQGLETDDLFGQLLRHPTFVDVCARQYGTHAPVSVFRAMVMNKPAGQGTHLPWHQDGGAVWALDRDPLVTIWVALDAAGPDNGCLEIVPGSHRLGLLDWSCSTLSDDAVAEHCTPETVLPLCVEAGHAVLLHNWLLHRSGVNPSSQPRRAFTCCYLDGRTRNQLTGELFPLVWGAPHVEPPPYLDHLRREADTWRASQSRAEEYALDLKATNEALQSKIAEATAYATSLESALRR